MKFWEKTKRKIFKQHYARIDAQAKYESMRAAFEVDFPETPHIIVDLTEDDPTRGDSQGYIGLAERLTKKLNGRLTIVDMDVLEAKLGSDAKEEETEIISLRKKFYETAGEPQILFCRNGYDIIKTPIHIRNINESLASNYNIRSQVVPHRICPDTLKKEKQKFWEHYPDLKGRRIFGVFLSNRTLTKQDCDDLILKALDNTPATIFMCSSRRTSHDHYYRMRRYLKKQIFTLGIQDQVNVEDFNLNVARKHKGDDESCRHKAQSFNPYIGLIGTSAYLFMAGSSQSIASELLASGKPIHRLDGCYADLGKSFYHHDFRNDDGHCHLQNTRIKTPDITDEVATAIAQRYLEKKQHRADLLAKYEVT